MIKLHFLEWPFVATSLRHTCAIIMLFSQHLNMPHLLGGWIGKEEVLTDMDLKFARNKYIVCTNKVLDILLQLINNGSKNKSVESEFVLSINCIYTRICLHTYNLLETNLRPCHKYQFQPSQVFLNKCYVNIGLH